MTISQLIINLQKHLFLFNLDRKFSLSASRNIKEIIEKKQGNTTIVDAVIKSHPKQHLLLKQSDNGACCLCSTNVNIKHTDVLILSQFVKSNGQILPRYVTGLCYVQQKRIGILITMAQKAGLMPNLGPANSKKNPKTRYQYKRFNTYYDETSIKQNYY